MFSFQAQGFQCGSCCHSRGGHLCLQQASNTSWLKIVKIDLGIIFRAGQTILPVSLLPPPGTITIEKSSAVGTVVGVRPSSDFPSNNLHNLFIQFYPGQVLIVMCLLGAGLGYFAYSNRRMRTRFVTKKNIEIEF